MATHSHETFLIALSSTAFPLYTGPTQFVSNWARQPPAGRKQAWETRPPFVEIREKSLAHSSLCALIHGSGRLLIIRSISASTFVTRGLPTRVIVNASTPTNISGE